MAAVTTDSDDTLLLARLAHWVNIQPDKPAAAFLASSGAVEQAFTYRQLDEETTRLALQLVHQEGIAPGERVVLVYPPGLEFGVAFLACLKARVVAVPVFPPNPTRKDTLSMFCKIVAGCRAKYALTNSQYQHAKKLSSLKDSLQLVKRNKNGEGGQDPQWPDALKWIVTTSAATGASDKKKKKTKSSKQQSLPALPTKDVLAFLQYTSGSTSVPKGVMIAHSNLQHNLQIITNELKAVQDTVVVSWLPQYHDMGLIGSFLGCLYCGGSGYYLSPLAFLQRPMLWMESVSKFRATHLQAPNFAFKLTARKYSTNTGSTKLNLSSVRHVINAAEPVDVDSMEAFYSKFEPHGLRRGVIYPTYGLAEHTVFVCSGGKQVLTLDKHELEVNGKVVLDAKNSTTTDASNSSTLVGCGYPHRQNVLVQIVNTEAMQNLPEDSVGEIWVHSPSKAQGYFEKPAETKEDFLALLAAGGNDNDSDGSKEFLRTGDLGFLHQQELFICGRLKDLIIVGGRNYYPQDIEATAEAAIVDQIRLGCSAAFTIDSTKSGDEEVALVMELKQVPKKNDRANVCEPLVNQVKAVINQEHSLSVAEIIMLETKTVPKTSSGKIARSWCRKGYVAGTLKVVYRKSFRSSYDNQTSPTMTPLEVDGTGAVAHSRPAGETPVPSATSSFHMAVANEIRAMDKAALVTRLQRDVSRVTGGAMQPESIDTKSSLATMMDSLTLSQFKGLFESSYASKISDEYLFRESTTIRKLAEVAKLGYAPDDDGNDLEGGAGGDAAVVSGAPGQATGLAGALGCPPGVVCTIL